MNDLIEELRQQTSNLNAEIKQLHQQLGNVLAVLNRDGGHHTEKVGIAQSIIDGLANYYALRVKEDQQAYALEQIHAAIDMTRMDLEACLALYKSLAKVKPLLELMTKNNAAEQAKETEK